MPMYFFVNKDNVALAKDIERGLFKAIEDGNFDRYFFDNPIIRNALARAGLENRKIFFLQNPVLPTQTPVDDARLWWAPASTASAPESQSSRKSQTSPFNLQ